MRSILGSLIVIMLFWGCSTESNNTAKKSGSTAKVVESGSVPVENAENKENTETKTEAAKAVNGEKSGTKTEAAASTDAGEGVFADISTNMGLITVQLEFEKTPLTVANFVGLAEGTKENTVKGLGTPYYDGIIFHRIIKGFMIQGGDPTGTGRGGPGYRFPDEIDGSLKHTGPGILSMANAGPGTNGSQFFITHTATPHLDGRHTVFGHVVAGMDVVNAIANVQTARGDRPVNPVVMNTVRIRRIGEKAKAFKGGEAHFKSIQSSNQKSIQSSNQKSYHIASGITIKFPEKWRVRESHDHRRKFKVYPARNNTHSINFIVQEASNERFSDIWTRSVNMAKKMRSNGVSCSVDSVNIGGIKAVKINGDLTAKGAGVVEQYLFHRFGYQFNIQMAAPTLAELSNFRGTLINSVKTISKGNHEDLLKKENEAAAEKNKTMEAKVKEKFPTAKLSKVGNFYIVSHKKGSGAKPAKGTKVSVHYTGSLLENGREFDSSVKRGTPFKFNVGAGRVIRGWDLAVANMKKGEKQTIILPPELGYGARGAGGVIPPNAWLVFEVELLDF